MSTSPFNSNANCVRMRTQLSWTHIRTLMSIKDEFKSQMKKALHHSSRFLCFSIFVFAVLMVWQLGYAAEAARMPNYDRWKDLPSQTLLDMGNAYWHSDKIDSALVCFMILTNRYNEKLSRPEKGICCGATVGAANLYLQSFNDFRSHADCADYNVDEHRLAGYSQAVLLMSLCSYVLFIAKQNSKILK